MSASGDCDVGGTVLVPVEPEPPPPPVVTVTVTEAVFPVLTLLVPVTE